MDINDIINPIQLQSMCISEYNVESISGVLLATTIQEPKMYKKVAIAGYNIDRLITLTQRGSLQ